MSKSDANKVGLYLDEISLKEIKAEAVRQERPISWIVQQAWKRAKKRVATLAPILGRAKTLTEQQEAHCCADSDFEECQ